MFCNTELHKPKERFDAQPLTDRNKKNGRWLFYLYCQQFKVRTNSLLNWYGTSPFSTADVDERYVVTQQRGHLKFHTVAVGAWADEKTAEQG